MQNDLNKREYFRKYSYVCVFTSRRSATQVIHALWLISLGCKTLNLYTAAILVFLNLRYQNECLENSWASPQWGCLWNVSSPLKRTTRNCLEKLSHINVTCSCSCQRLLGKIWTLTHSLVRSFSKWAFFSFRRILTWKRNATNRDEEEKTRSQKKGFC